MLKSLISVAQWWWCFWVPFLVCKRKGVGGENLLVFLLLVGWLVWFFAAFILEAELQSPSVFTVPGSNLCLKCGLTIFQ